MTTFFHRQNMIAKEHIYWIKHIMLLDHAFQQITMKMTLTHTHCE